jgi:hypothetical protein
MFISCRFAPCAFISLVWITGCTSPVHIASPTPGIKNDPVPQLQVSFLSNFNPSEPWHVSLDGVFVTGFTPAPAPGVTSTVPLVYQPIPSSGSAHTLTTDATCGTFCVYNAETVAFNPPLLIYNGTNVPSSPPTKQFTTVGTFIGVQNAPTVPITVTIVETTTPFPKLQLGLTPGSLKAPGTTLFVTIPAGSTQGTFFVNGQGLGNYQLQMTAAGATPGFGGGTVKP